MILKNKLSWPKYLSGFWVNSQQFNGCLITDILKKKQGDVYVSTLTWKSYEQNKNLQVAHKTRQYICAGDIDENADNGNDK